MLLDNEPWISKFRIIDPTEKKNKSEEGGNEKQKDYKQNGWKSIGLNYQVEWPFYSLITKTVLEKLVLFANFLISLYPLKIFLI